MNIAIVGSRAYKYLENIEYKMNQYADMLFSNNLPMPTVISGGAKGPDSVAVEVAKELGWKYEVYRANWYKYGKAAGHKRNSIIVAKSNLMWAFWDGESRGTLDSITKAVKACLPVEIYPNMPWIDLFP